MGVFQTFSKYRGAILLSCAVNTGSILFGFDTGVSGGVVALSSFKSDFHLSSSATKYALASSNIVALLNAGAFFGSAVPAIISKWVGRRHQLLLAAFLVLIGGIIQTAAQTPHLSMLYGGRVIAGLGIGILSSVCPVFVAECAPAELRGIMMSAFEMFLVSGGMLAYWTVYGCSVHMLPSSRQWRVPFSLQIVLSVLVMFLTFFIVESPRWLAKQGRWEQATDSLCYLRSAGPEDPELLLEMAAIKAQIEEEIEATKGRTVKEMFAKKNLQRLTWALGVGLWAMWCGHNAILYYGPTIFKQIGFQGQDASIFASGMFTVIKVIATIAFLAGMVRFFKRKTLLILGSFFMGAFLFSLGAVLKTHPPAAVSSGSISSASHGMMAFIYLYVIAYSVSWGPLQWVYIGEIFPIRLRDWGMAAGAMMIWLNNYVVSKVAPIMVLNIGWKTWMVFGVTNICGMVFAFYLPETGGKTLEEMDILFGVVDEGTRLRDIEMAIEKKEKILAGEKEVTQITQITQ